MDGYQGQCNRLYGTLVVHLKRQSPVARAFFWMQCLRMALWSLISEPEMVKWADFAHAVLPAVGSVSPWSLWLTVTSGSLQMRHGQQALCPDVAGWGASVSNIAMKRDGGPWVVESVPGRVWWLGQSLPLFKIWCRVMTVFFSPGIRYTPQHGRWTWRVFRRAGLCKVFVAKFDVVSAKLDVFKFELLLGAKRLKIWSDTNKGSGHVQFEWLCESSFNFVEHNRSSSVGWRWGMEHPLFCQEICSGKELKDLQVLCN